MQRDAIVNTPGSIQADMDTVRGLLHQLDDDIKASKATTVFKKAWQGFVDEFEHFYTETGYWARWWYATKEKTDEFRRRLADWRTMFVAEGGRPTSPEDHPPGTGGGWWKLAALGIGAAVVGAIAVKSLSSRHSGETTPLKGDL